MPDFSSIATNALKSVRIIAPALPGRAGGETVLAFDCSITESHDSETVPTEFEVENGSMISDHMILKPRSLKLQAIITDAPLKLLSNLLTTGIGAVTPSTGGIGQYAGAVALAPALIQSLDPRARKSVVAFADLIQVQALRQPVSVWTSLELYVNMWIRKISIPRDAQTGRAITVNIDFQQLLLVEPDTVLVGVVSDPNIGSAEANKGNKGTGLGIDPNKFSEGRVSGLADAAPKG